MDPREKHHQHHSKEPCEPPFWVDPAILLRRFRYIPVCDHSAWNFVAQVTLISFVLGSVMALVMGSALYVAIALFFGGLTAFGVLLMTPPVKVPAHRGHSRGPSSSPSSVDEDGYQIVSEPPPPPPHQAGPQAYVAPIREHFVNGKGGPSGQVQPVGVEEVDAFPYTGPSLPDYTPPTSRNLFMNVLLEEMKYNPTRPEAAPVDHPMVKQAMDDYFRVQWFSDPTDVFGKNQGQRQFITQPSTTVPNGQGDFANWLYRIPGKTCKEGGRDACLAGTDGGQFPWLSHSS